VRKLPADGYEEIRKAPVLTYLVGRSPFSDLLFFFFMHPLSFSGHPFSLVRRIALSCQKICSSLSDALAKTAISVKLLSNFTDFAAQFH